MIIDSFPYAGEATQLDIRVHELESIITKFLIIESNRTQTGLPKPYYFEEQKEAFKDFLDKIVYVKLDDSNINYIPESNWSQEFRMRRAITSEGFNELQKNGIVLLADDILIVSDVDEIPRKECVLDFQKRDNQILCLNHLFNSYYLNLYSNFRSWGWYGSILIKMGGFTDDIQYLRNVKDRLPHSGNSNEGWHYSNLLFNGFSSLYNKWKNNIEPHSKENILGKENKLRLKKQFEKCLYEDKNFFFCDDPQKRQILLEKLDISELPQYVQNNLSKFSHLLFPDNSQLVFES
jgi:beta-1,4-mannosyl-glycoprotein beta-1,4-N-acetylglucosaminyltransferase